jgi:hypothetical protein
MEQHTLTTPETVIALATSWSQLSHEPGWPLIPSHCINGTRIGIEALRHFGVEAEPLSVRFAVFNRKGWSAAQIGMPFEEWPQDAWSVGINEGSVTAGENWAGHLVIHVPEWCVVDLSAEQFARPARELFIDGPLILPGPPPDPGVEAFHQMDNGVIVHMNRWPDNTGWESAPGWQRTPTNRAVLRSVIALMEEKAEHIRKGKTV